MGARKTMNIEQVEKKKLLFKSLNRKLFVSIIFCIVLYLGLQIYTMSVVGTRSGEIERVRIEKNEIRLENEIIESKIREQKSVLSVADDLKEQYSLQEKVVQEITLDPSNELALR